jgi:hypothetical protein
MAREWFIKNGDAVEGPIGSSELRKRAAAGSIQRDTPIRPGHSGEWVPARRVRDLFIAEHGSIPAATAPEVVSSEQVDGTAANTTPPRALLTNVQVLIVASATGISLLGAVVVVGMFWRHADSARGDTSPVAVGERASSEMRAATPQSVPSSVSSSKPSSRPSSNHSDPDVRALHDALVNLAAQAKELQNGTTATPPVVIVPSPSLTGRGYAVFINNASRFTLRNVKYRTPYTNGRWQDVWNPIAPEHYVRVDYPSVGFPLGAGDWIEVIADNYSAGRWSF